MAQPMSIEKAEAIAAAVADARRKWGKHASVGVTEADIYTAIMVLQDARAAKSEEGKEELTKLRRQLAACQNREKARQSKE